MRKLARKVWNGWKKVALRIARFQTALLLTLFYFLLLVPTGFVFGLFGWDPLAKRRLQRRKSSNWQPAKLPEPDREALKHQS
ncbi:MAG: hypothetical protein OEV49_02000 [candidate division Zixibacteria bacterium]|nr:hypothetical protein [candidate division Zixibacteria bacterium]MDH3937207.1 hypothetical protein [candidate division Zixibacteria bacterium]MDH4032664.1 hypothetical protein [candidate division Zixibacteria bacterium]